MKMNLSGTWKLWLESAALSEEPSMDYLMAVAHKTESGYMEKPERPFDGEIALPGILQAQGYGNPITGKTPWVSGLHDPFWYEREEYQYGQKDGCHVPFLSQPPRHYIGRAWYEREIDISEEKEWSLFLELTHWRTYLWMDGMFIGSDCSLCTAHEIEIGQLQPGRHQITICVDNRFQYAYRPDGHQVSDALGASWNGMAGELCLMSREEKVQRDEERENYAREHFRHIEVKNGKFYVDNRPEYFRGTHFGGDYPLTGYPSTDITWWKNMMDTVKAWGLNFVRCHSCCPPEAAFLAADEAGVYLQPECGMWNIFEESIEMNQVLREETERILRQFGHHPSFVLFSPSNEPGGQWYKPLKQWVSQTQAYDESLGYGGRRIYTAQSGWFYDVPPGDITGTDYIYFHRSGYGPINGGNIRNYEGWKGKDYSPSLQNVKLPVICHEMGQWCAYPDFSVMEKFTGYLQPGNYQVFREHARACGLLKDNKEFAYHSGKNQVLMYKEEIETNLRTPHIYGFEMLDLHDYLGQGTALVGVLDPFWESKGYIEAEEFRHFCNETVILARIPSYVFKNTDCISIPIEVCHFGKEDLLGQKASWYLKDDNGIQKSGELEAVVIIAGENTILGSIELDFSFLTQNQKLELTVQMQEIENTWTLYVYTGQKAEADQVVYSRVWSEAMRALKAGRRVVYAPLLNSLDYFCPPASMRPVFWNAQMGPGWGRSLGLVIDTKHPIFQQFPTDSFGGWQWEDILEQARAFSMDSMPGKLKPVVTVIDDWNRNLPLALVWEGQVEQGNLLVVTACLEGTFEERPAAYALKQAILDYAASEKFCPNTKIRIPMIERHLYSNQLAHLPGMSYVPGEGEQVTDLDALYDPNPGRSVKITGESYPLTLSVCYQSRRRIKGIVVVPEQRDRMLKGCIRDYEIRIDSGDGSGWRLVAKGRFPRSILPQEVYFDAAYQVQRLQLTVRSGYEHGKTSVWTEHKDGWYLEEEKEMPMIQIGGFHQLPPWFSDIREEGDELFWKQSQKSRTKEIED